MSGLFTAVSRYAGNGAKSHDLSYDLKVLPVPTGSSFCIHYNQSEQVKRSGHNSGRVFLRCIYIKQPIAELLLLTYFF